MLCEDFKETVKQVIEKQEFGPVHQCIQDILSNALQGVDPYLVGVDFQAYIKAQEEINRIFQNKKEFCKRIVNTLSKLGNLQIDKSMKDYCERVWTTPQVEVPKPSLNPKQRVRSWANLLSMNNHSSSNNAISDASDENSELIG